MLPLNVGTQRMASNNWALHLYARMSASRAALRGIQHILHAPNPTPHTALSLVLARSLWSMKRRCAPSRNCNDARLYGHTTTADKNGMSTPTPRLDQTPIVTPPRTIYRIDTRITRGHDQAPTSNFGKEYYCWSVEASL